MTMRIKTWKVGQIMTDMSKYGDRYDVDVEGQTWGVNYKDCEDSEGYVNVLNVREVLKETEKAMQLDIDGFKTWVPKSAIA